MGEESKSKLIKDIKVKDLSEYKHHKVGEFTCESEVLKDDKTICCLHNPVTGDWKWVTK